MTCFGTGLRKLFFVCVIAAFGVIAVSSGFGLGICSPRSHSSRHINVKSRIFCRFCSSSAPSCT